MKQVFSSIRSPGLWSSVQMFYDWKLNIRSCSRSINLQLHEQNFSRQLFKATLATKKRVTGDKWASHIIQNPFLFWYFMFL